MTKLKTPRFISLMTVCALAAMGGLVATTPAHAGEGSQNVESEATFYRVAPAEDTDAAADKAPKFLDVDTDNQFYKEITWLAEKGVTTGWTVGAGRQEFRPLQPVARDAMAAFLYRLADSPEFTPPATSPFVDVSPTNMFYKEITWLYHEKISTGWDAGEGRREFRPLAPIARDAMAAFLYRYANTVLDAGAEDYEPQSVSPFSDIKTDNLFYKEISWLAEEKVSTGWPVGDKYEFRPLKPIARDAMAAFMYRLVNSE